MQDEEGDEPFCNCSAGHSIEETDRNQCDSCGKPIYDEEVAAATIADGGQVTPGKYYVVGERDPEEQMKPYNVKWTPDGVIIDYLDSRIILE